MTRSAYRVCSVLGEHLAHRQIRFRFIARQLGNNRRRRRHSDAEYFLYDPIAALHRTGSESGRILSKKYGHRQQPAASVTGSIIHTNPVAHVACYSGYAVVLCQRTINERVVSIEKIQDRAIIRNQVLHEPDRLLKHCFAQIVVERGKALAIHRVVGLELAKTEPVAGELSGHAPHAGVFQHAPGLRQQDVRPLQVTNGCVPQQLIIGHAGP